MKMMRNLITVSETLRYREILTSFTATYEEHKETLIDIIDNLTRHSYIAKLQNTSFWYRTKSKANTGVKHTASYIPWLHTIWGQMVASNMIHCVLVLMTGTITLAFCIKFKQCLLIILKLIYFSDSCGGQYRSYKNFMDLCSHKDDFGISAEWVFFTTSYCKSPYHGVGWAVKTTRSQAFF